MSTTTTLDFIDVLFPGGHSDLFNCTMDEGDKEYPAVMSASDLDTAAQTDTSDPEAPNEPNTIVSMSTAFNASSDFGDGPPDMTLVSIDTVHFYVRQIRLLAASTSSFDSLLSSPPYQPNQASLSLDEDAITLNIVLHIIYNIPFRHYSPSLDVLLKAAKALKKYGIPMYLKLAPGTSLFEELVAKIPFAPIEVYAIAAENDLFPLATEASSYLLSFQFSSLSDEMSLHIGPIYLLMLFHLHTERLRVLQSLVTSPPREHRPTLLCGWTDYQRLKTAWSLACASFVFNASPDLSPGKIRSILESLGILLSCEECKRCITERVQEIVMKWSITPRTIRRNIEDFHAVLS